jgi:hypothetical protein
MHSGYSIKRVLTVTYVLTWSICIIALNFEKKQKVEKIK